MSDTKQRPRFQQTVYDEGYACGRRDGFKDGETYGRGIQRFEDELKPLVGFVFGIMAGVALAWIVPWLVR